jgi:site-specific DNA-methyltransferase (adenine-specific)
MLEINKIYLGDCLEVMKDIDDKSIDLVITDPPYGINYSSYGTNSKKIINDDNLEWVVDFIGLLASKVKEDSHLYCFVDFEYMPEFVLEFRKYWKIRNLLKIPRCIKGNGGDRIFQQQDEYVIFATKGKGRRFSETQILKPS